MEALFLCLAKRATHRPVCLSMSSILVWNTGSTASTLTPVPLWAAGAGEAGREGNVSTREATKQERQKRTWGMANTSTTLTV